MFIFLIFTCIALTLVHHVRKATLQNIYVSAACDADPQEMVDCRAVIQQLISTLHNQYILFMKSVQVFVE